MIRQRIENARAMDYPEDCLEIVVVSDGSTDGTEAIVRSIGDARVRLVALPVRQGKTAGLNLVVPLATGAIAVFDPTPTPCSLRMRYAPWSATFPIRKSA